MCPFKPVAFQLPVGRPHAPIGRQTCANTRANGNIVEVMRAAVLTTATRAHSMGRTSHPIHCHHHSQSVRLFVRSPPPLPLYSKYAKAIHFIINYNHVMFYRTKTPQCVIKSKQKPPVQLSSAVSQQPAVANDTQGE